MSKYFTLQELIYSDTAIRNGITNMPPPSIEVHLNELMLFLDELRIAWGSAIRVTSGYRCNKLNRLVGGADTSAHLVGYAADLQPVNGKMKEFKQFVQNWIKDKIFDQCLLEKSRTAEWVHIGLKNQYGKQRKEIKLLNV